MALVAAMLAVQPQSALPRRVECKDTVNQYMYASFESHLSKCRCIPGQ